MTECVGKATAIIRDDNVVKILNNLPRTTIIEDSAEIIVQKTNPVIVVQDNEHTVVSIPCTVTYGASVPCDPDEENFPVYSKRVDFIDDTLLYRGEAQPGTLESSPAWRIRKITIAELDNDIVETWADGTDAFTKIWDNHLSYTYS